jgi:transcriptional regulator GlxA family with amidase domain
MYDTRRGSDLAEKAAQSKISEQCREETALKQFHWTESKRHSAGEADDTFEKMSTTIRNHSKIDTLPDLKG